MGRPIDIIPLVPNGDSLRTKIGGELSGMLGLAAGTNAGSAEDLTVQITLVAGTGFEPVTFRL
jgi:hypothetical protein